MKIELASAGFTGTQSGIVNRTGMENTGCVLPTAKSVIMPMPDEILRHAAWYLMGQKSIWYDRVADEYGNVIAGPHHESVMMLCKLASDSRTAFLIPKSDSETPHEDK